MTFKRLGFLVSVLILFIVAGIHVQANGIEYWNNWQWVVFVLNAALLELFGLNIIDKYDDWIKQRFGL